jgi:hypothetical protein
VTQGQLTLNRTAQRSGLAHWLTVERAAYAGIAILALGLRLYGLGQTLLGPAEAAQALPAWAAAAHAGSACAASAGPSGVWPSP